jgi:hypothetical protein
MDKPACRELLKTAPILANPAAAQTSVSKSRPNIVYPPRLVL